MAYNVSETYFFRGITTGSVSATTGSVVVLADNPERKMATFCNDSTATMYLKFGPNASFTDFNVKLLADDYYELPKPVYTGSLSAKWTAVTGSVKVSDTY